MPPRKRGTHKNEGQRKVLRADDNEEQDDVVVVPDSENEEEEDTIIRQSRAARYRERTSRSQMQDMTEEEMLDLAMKLSKQEANSAAQRQQLEDDDMRKAIAESLLVSHSQASDVSSGSAMCMTKLSSHPPTVKPYLGRKLSFPRKSERTRASDDVTAATESGEDSTQDSRPLPQMPDLSQRTLSQPSSPSTVFEEWHSTHRKDQNEQVLKVDYLEDESTQNDSQHSVRLQQCSVTLSKKPMSTSRALRNPLSTQDSSLCAACPSRSQVVQPQSPSPHKSPIFDQADPKGSIELSDDKVSCCTSTDNGSDKVGTPKEDDNGETFKDTSHKEFQQSRDPQKRLSLYGKSKPSHHTSVPDDVDPEQEAVQPKQLKDDSSRGTSLSAILERVTKSEELPLPANNKSLEEFTSHIVLHLSDDDENEEEEERVVPPSPVFHQEFVSRPDHPRLSPTQPCCSLPTDGITQDCSCTLGCSTQNSNSQHECVRRTFTSVTAYPAESDQLEVDVQNKPACDSRPIHPMDRKEDGHVSYYWGVPFCPRGQSPDDYTRVILSQLEVYEKSLKEAQRQLLHKVKWGPPLSPCRAERPFGRRMKRHIPPKLLEEDEDAEPEKQGEKEKNVEGETEEGRAESQAHSEEAENGQGETYVVVSSPETQEELAPKSNLLFGQQKSTGAVKLSSISSPCDLPENTQIQQPDEHEDIQNENFDVESTVCPETQMSEDNTPELMVTSPAQPQSRTESEVMEVDEEETPEDMTMVLEQEQAEMEQQQQRGLVPPQTQRVECPMCSCLFPISKIEVHAAYCDGTTEGEQQQNDLSQVAQHKRSARTTVDKTTPRFNKFIHHLNKYLRQGGPRSTLGEQMPIDDSDDGAGPSDVTVKNHSGLTDSSVLAEGGGNGVCPASGLVSSSPIRSFIPISETTDCLVDFQQQCSARASQRQGRKRKFKR